VSFKSLTKGWSHVVWQIVPCPWADNRESPVGWRRLSTWPAAALADGWCQQNGEVGGQASQRHSWVEWTEVLRYIYIPVCSA